jgi:hypothetical protein
MAAPLTKRQTSGHIDSIQTSKLINKLQNHALDDADMSTSQIKAAQILIDRTIPVLKATEISVDKDTLTSMAIYKGNAPKPADD